jgi:chromosome segregation ATPase
MSANVSSPPSDDLLAKIWAICSTLTEEAFSAATAKANEMSFDQNRGVIPLAESFINLSSARFILEDAIEKQKLVQLPITVQREILSNLEQIAKSLQSLTSGTDEIVIITNSIESLNTSIWKYGLHNLSDEVLGYQKKLNQIKNQEVQLRKAISELDSARKVAEKVSSAASDVEKKKKETNDSLEQIKQNMAASASITDQIRDAESKSTALFSTIQQQEKQGGELTSSMRTASSELSSLDASIRKFYGEVEDYRKRIDKTSEDAASLIRSSEGTLKKLVEDTVGATRSALEAASEETKTTRTELQKVITANANESRQAFSTLSDNLHTDVKEVLDQARIDASKINEASQERMEELEKALAERSETTIGANQKKTDELIAHLEGLRAQIHEQIQQATGFQLFGAFQARQNEIAKSKKFWVWAIAVLVALSAGVTIWIAHEAQSYSVNNFAFWVKLSLTIPLGFALTFCTVQYSRERRLEEEYAFKSSISVSLNPYRDMILTILEKGGTDLGKYTDFVIDSVRNVFTPPTDKVFESAKRPASLSEKTFKQVAEVIGTGIKAAK